MKPYPKYKDSGIEWLGEVPEGWHITNLRRLSSAISKGTTPSTLGKDMVDEGVRFIKGENIQGGVVVDTPAHFIDIETDEMLSRSRLQAHDVLFVIAGSIGKTAIVKESDAPANTNQAICFIRLSNKNHSKYVHYWLSTDLVQQLVSLDLVQTAQPNVSMDDIGRIPLLLADTAETNAIASFLDKETERIDALIQKKERMIELLKEKRIAMITQAVTKGLDPNVPMKDSGIELLGEVPEHWEMKRMKDLLLPKKGAIKTGPFGSQLLSSEMEESDVKIYNQKSVISKDFEYGENYISFDKFEDLKEFQTYPGDFLITTRGTIGRCAILPPDSEKGILHPCLMRLQTNKNVVDDRFLEILIEESQVILEQLKLKSNGTTIEVIYQDSLKNVTVLLPPLHEQLLIAEYLDLKTNRIDILIHQIETSVNLLREYRSSLINAAVTGKIDLREAL